MLLNNIALLKNPVQEYSWGSKTKIQSLIGAPESVGKPMAELWMGAHPKAPSQVLINGVWHNLNKLIKKNPKSILGEKVATKFHNQLPFLFKILAAEKPLSVQVHPNVEQAQEGFTRQNDLGIPFDAPNRCYKDNNHKPEILCALTPFYGLQGFRKVEEILDLIDRLSLSILTDELNLLRKNPDSNGLKTFFSGLMSMDKNRQNDVTTEVISSAEKLVGEEQAFQWIIKLNQEYPGDIGILSPAILNLVKLKPGEAIYLPAGELHAYLDGLGIELMANSDNVLRGGLTQKHIDISELLRIVNFNAGPVRKIKSTALGMCQTTFETLAEEFILSIISVDDANSFTSSDDRSVEILFCLDGNATIRDLGNNNVLTVCSGQSLIVPSQISFYQIDGNATFYLASVPL